MSFYKTRLAKRRRRYPSSRHGRPKRSLREQVRHLKQLLAGTNTEVQRKKIEQLIASIEWSIAYLDRETKILAQQRAELRLLNQGTLQERVAEALRQLRAMTSTSTEP